MGDCAGDILFMVGDCACETVFVYFLRGREVGIFVGVREVFVGVREVIVGVREVIPNYEFQMLFRK